MKWLVIIVILAVLAAIVWLRMVRDRPAASGPAQPHRLDDSLEPTDPAGDEPPGPA